MQFVCAKYTLLLISIQMVASEYSEGCPFYTWRCNNGQCIKAEELCDGSYDCDDKSDETIDECLLRPCPSYAFQCAYGACITGNFKCNGVINCVDGSDETRFLCNSKLNYEMEIQGKCTYPFSMECESGECINNENLCDGKPDCIDGSDETVAVCSFLKCPEYSFRCGYGACVPGLAACNGSSECLDDSDEIASICSNITSTTTTTAKPYSPPSNTTDATTTTPTTTTTTTERPHTLGNFCSPSTLMRGISSVALCYHKHERVSCYHGIQSGTIANVTCNPGYAEKNPRNNFSVIKCDSDGEWTRPKMKCSPACGITTQQLKENPTKPWEVTIFIRLYKPIYTPICSGVIVSPKVVLTAATCFLDSSRGYNTDHIFYNLVQGFHNESYSEGNNLNLEVHNISSISIKAMHQTQDLAVLVLVNYFHFSKTFVPICLPTAQSNLFPFYSNNHLNIGRPILRDTSRTYLEYLISSVETKTNGKLSSKYVNIYYFIPFINREIKKYDYLL